MFRGDDVTSSLWASFKCQQCGQCCEKLGLPWPSSKNLKEMAKFLKMDADDIIERYYGNLVKHNGKKFIEKYQKDRRTPCPFLGNDKNCKIYTVRPDPCRAYPLDTDFGRCEIDCPGMRKILNNNGVCLEKEEEYMTHSLDLDFVKPGKTDLPGPPRAHIYIKSYSKSNRGFIFITPDCVSIEELEYEIDRLQKELEVIRKKARRKFAGTGK